MYGFIGLTAIEDKILDSIPMQRLSRIKQLAHAYIVYPSSVHTRLEHSLGAMYIAGRMCDQLGLDQKDKELCRIATLLHDCGHGPFSHLFEEIMSHVNGESYSHEDTTKLMIANDPQIKKALGPVASLLPDIFDGNSILSQILSSSLDADKMDYLRRDSYHTGVAYGVFDLERVVRSVCKVSDEEVSYLAIDYKAQEAIESYRLARYAMHTQVYEHHTRLIADDMFVRAVIHCIDQGFIPREYFDVADPEKFLPRYLELDDASIEHMILSRAKGIPRDLIKDIRNRELLKRTFIVPLTKEGVPNPLKRDRLINMTRDEIKRKERKIADEAKLDPEYVIVHLQSIKIKLYERFEQSIGTGNKDKPILIRKPDRSMGSLDEESPISASVNPIRRLYVFCPDAKKSEVRSIAEGVFEAKSLYVPQ